MLFRKVRRQERISDRHRERDVDDAAFVDVPKFPATESEFAAPKTVGSYGDMRPSRNSLSYPVHIFHDYSSIGLF